MENSRVKLNQSEPNQIAIGLRQGKIFNIISKYVDKVTTYKVITPTAVAGVRGTVFSAETINEEESIIMVKEGKLGVSNPAVSPEEVTVGDLQKTIVKKGKFPTLPVALTAAEIALFAIIADLLSAAGGAAAATAAAAGGGGISTGTAIAVGAGLVAVGGVAAAGGGNGGNGEGTTTTPTTTPTSTAGPCSQHAGNWGGSYSGTDCLGEAVSGSWSMEIREDCSLTMDGMSGSVSGNSVSASGPNEPCGEASLYGIISGTSINGSWSSSRGGSGSWFGSKGGGGGGSDGGTEMRCPPITGGSWSVEECRNQGCYEPVSGCHGLECCERGCYQGRVKC